MLVSGVLINQKNSDCPNSVEPDHDDPPATAKTNILRTGVTDTVWFYDMKPDGLSLDGENHENNNIPDIIARWKNREQESDRERTDQSFLVPKDEIADNGYDLSINRYKEIVYEEVEHDPPQMILANHKDLEAEIQERMEELEGMLG